MAVRGQATTEAALGILVISTVILFGIHFSEVSILSLKVQEASASAIWDATGKKMHDLKTAVPSFTPRQNAISAAGPDASAKYADFDGRASKGVTTSPTLAFTQTTSITVTCAADNSLPPMALPGNIGGLFSQGQGGMSCYAESDFSLVPGFTRRFLQNRPFREQHVTVNQYHICSVGRANGNNCRANVVVALGDWGLAEGVESNNCGLVAPGGRCQNPGYYDMTKWLYEQDMGTTPQEGGQLSRWLFGDPFGGPTLNVDESAFFMNAVGEDWTPYAYQSDQVEHQGVGRYTTTPGGPYNGVPQYDRAARQRSDCAFGFPCDPTGWPAYR